jgi:hypothetical protein
MPGKEYGTHRTKLILQVPLERKQNYIKAFLRVFSPELLPNVFTSHMNMTYAATSKTVTNANYHLTSLPHENDICITERNH